MEFDGSQRDRMELSPLFSDNSRVAKAASIAQKISEIHMFLRYSHVSDITLTLTNFFYLSIVLTPYAYYLIANV